MNSPTRSSSHTHRGRLPILASLRNRSRSSFQDRKPPRVPLGEAAREQEQSRPQEQPIADTANHLLRSIRPRLAPLVSGDLQVVRPHAPTKDKNPSAHGSFLLQTHLQIPLDFELHDGTGNLQPLHPNKQIHSKVAPPKQKPPRQVKANAEIGQDTWRRGQCVEDKDRKEDI